MIPVTSFAGQAVAVFGLGASGLSTCRALLAGGATVAAWDDTAASRDAAANAGIALVDLADADWSKFAALVLAPGVPLTHPEPHWTVVRARHASIEVIGDIELFCRERTKVYPGSPFVAITGTNGKSTTTALITHILRLSGRDAQMGGNIGQAILTLDPPSPSRIHVIEMSSFQIDLTPSLAPTIGVLLNLSPDHLDRHGPADDADAAMAAYADLKARLVTSATEAVIGVDDDWCKSIAEALRGRASRRLRRFTAASEPYDLDGDGVPDLTPHLAGTATLRGRHNLQNAIAAVIVCLGLDVPFATIAAALRTYPGLPHRMEEIGHLQTDGGRVLFLNDSKATNADSTEKALASFPGGIFWILGGKPKEGGITSLATYFPRIAKAYLIGQASDEFAATLAGKVVADRCGTLDVALSRASADASVSGLEEAVVLLSPACASYDQFRSFEHRGATFRDAVRAIPGLHRRQDTSS